MPRLHMPASEKFLHLPPLNIKPNSFSLACLPVGMEVLSRRRHEPDDSGSASCSAANIVATGIACEQASPEMSAAPLYVSRVSSPPLLESPCSEAFPSYASGLPL